MKRACKILCVPCLLGMAAATAPALVWSEAGPAQGPIPFQVFDSDGDGYVSEAEFNAAHSARMQSRAEQGRPMYGAANAPPFSAFDTDGDGRLTRAELGAGQAAQMQQRRNAGTGPGPVMGPGMGRNMPSFSDFDLDGDGFLAEQEFDEAHARRIGERAAQGYPMRNLGNAPAFSAIDSDGDGRVSPQEFSEHQIRHRQGMQP